MIYIKNNSIHNDLMTIYLVKQGGTVLVTDHCPKIHLSPSTCSVNFHPRTQDGRLLRNVVLQDSDLPPMRENTVYTVTI